VDALFARGRVPGLAAGDELDLFARDLGDAEDVRVGADLLDHLDAARRSLAGELERLRPEPSTIRSSRVPRPAGSGTVSPPKETSRSRRRAARRGSSRRADEAGDERVHRPLVELARRVALLQPPSCSTATRWPSVIASTGRA
jgi:hypothetical protein